MKRKIVYESRDGKTFADESEARIHEHKLDALEQLTALLCISIKTGRPESVLREMLEEDTASKARAILAKLCQRFPRESQVEEKAIAA